MIATGIMIGIVTAIATTDGGEQGCAIGAEPPRGLIPRGG